MPNTTDAIAHADPTQSMITTIHDHAVVVQCIIGDPLSMHREKRPKIDFDLLVDLIYEMFDFIMIYRSANPAIIP